MGIQKTYFNWSTGKDSAMALHYLLQDRNFSVDYLLTTVSAKSKRVSMHDLPTELLQQQVEAIGIKSGTIELPELSTNAEYEHLMSEKVSHLKAKGFEYAAFGDIFLEDLKKYREQQLARLRIKTVFPLWKKDTAALMDSFISEGFKAIVVCVNADLLDRSFAGRLLDQGFINDLPKNVDPCGENGEFHTFCFDAPFYKHPIQFKIGETIYKEFTHGKLKSRFWFCNLLSK